MTHPPEPSATDPWSEPPRQPEHPPPSGPPPAPEPYLPPTGNPAPEPTSYGNQPPTGYPVPGPPAYPAGSPGYPAGSPAYSPGSAGYPTSGAPDYSPGGPVIVQIGDMAITSSVVHTPAGDIPLAGSTWQVSDYWHSEQKIPTWAIVAAIVGFCVLTVFSLLFLLVKVTVPRGTVQVTVTNGTRQYIARIPVTDQNQVTHVHQQVNYVRSLAAL